MTISGVAHGVAQNILNKAELAFVNSNITNVGEESFVIVVNSQLSHAGSFDATLNGVTIGLEYEGQRMASCLLPPINIKAGHENKFTLHSLVHVEDQEVFVRFSTALLNEPVVSWGLKTESAVVTVHMLWSVGVSVDDLVLNKQVPLPGAQGMLHPRINEFSLAGSNQTSVNVAASVSLFNPGAFNILPVGDMELEMVYENTKIGNMYAADVFLTRGWNTIQLFGVLQNYNTSVTDKLISAYLGGQAVNVTTRGVVSPYTPRPFRVALSHLQLQVELPPWNKPLVAGMHVQSMTVQPAPDSQVPNAVSATRVALGMQAVVTVNSPLGPFSPLTVRSVAMDVELQGNGKSMGELVVPPTAPLPTPAPAVCVSVSSGGVAAARPSTPPLQPLQGGLKEVQGPATPVNITLDINTVLDLDSAEHAGAFSAFMGEFLNAPDVQVGLSSLSSHSLSTVVDMALGQGIEIIVPMPPVATQVKGMNKLGHVVFESFQLTGAVPAPGSGNGVGLAMQVSVSIDNPSPANVPLGGNVTMAVLGPDPASGQLVQLGTVTGTSLELKSGANSLAMHGVLDSPGSDAAQRALDAMTSAYMTGHHAPVSCRGVGVTMPGGGAAPAWLQAAVTNLQLATVLPPADIPALLTDFDLSTLFMDFTQNGGVSPVTEGFMFADVHVPFENVDITFETANVTFDMTLEEGGPTMAQIILVDVATMYTPFPFKKPNGATGLMSVNIPITNIVVRNESLMAEFVKRSFINESLTLFGRLHANQTVQLPLGQVHLTGVDVPVSIPLTGMHSLSYPPVMLHSAEVVKGTATEMFFLSNITITNPSQFIGDFGPVSLQIWFDGQLVGTSKLSDLALSQGANNFTATGIIQPPPAGQFPERAAACDAFLSRYLTGQDSQVALVGTVDTTGINLLKPAFSSFSAHGVLPGHHQKLILNSTFDLTSIREETSQEGASTVTGKVSQGLQNPYNLPVQILGSKLDIFACNDETASEPHTCPNEEYQALIAMFTSVDLSQDPIVLPPAGQVLTNFIQLPLYNLKSELLPLSAHWLLDKYVPVQANGTMTVKVQDFSRTLSYFQQEIPLYAKL